MEAGSARAQRSRGRTNSSKSSCLLAAHPTSSEPSAAVAEHSWAALEEGWYPIDATAANLRQLVHADDLERIATTTDRTAWKHLDPPEADDSTLTQLLGGPEGPTMCLDTGLSNRDAEPTLDYLSTPAAAADDSTHNMGDTW